MVLGVLVERFIYGGFWFLEEFGFVPISIHRWKDDLILEIGDRLGGYAEILILITNLSWNGNVILTESFEKIITVYM